MKNEIIVGKGLGVLIKEKEKITFSDVKEHLAGPLSALVIHIAILIFLFNMTVSDQMPSEDKNVTVEVKQVEEIVSPEVKPEETDPPEVDIPDPTQIFQTTDFSTISFKDEMPTGEVSDVVSKDSLSEMDVPQPRIVISPSDSQHIIKCTSPFGRIGGGGEGNGDGDGAIPGNMLQGVFYDLKQLKNHTASGESGNLCSIMKAFVNSSWTKKKTSGGSISYPMLDRFFSAPQRLWNSCFYIPLMPAENAPAAYKCEKEVKTGGWVAIYSGRVIAPVTGRVRFVGSADDVIVVRFNNQVVLDYGYFSFTIGGPLSGDWRNAITRKANAPKSMIAEVEKMSPYADPVTIYNFANSPANAFASGKIIEVEEGQPYDIEIIISEIPGGVFHGALFVEYLDDDPALADYDSRGNRLLPLFSTNGALPEIDPKYVSYSRDLRCWKTVPENYKAPKTKKKAVSDDDFLTI